MKHIFSSSNGHWTCSHEIYKGEILTILKKKEMAESWPMLDSKPVDIPAEGNNNHNNI